MLIIFFILSYLIYALILGVRELRFRGSGLSVVYFLGGMWFIPLLSTGGFIKVLQLGRLLLKYVDQGWVELLRGQGAYKIYSRGASGLDLTLSSRLKIYLFSFFLVVGLLLWLL